jgi:DNA repair exonuclease SbcCD ATPase subunit
MPNNTEVKSNRDRYTERLKAKYPDKEFADDEALFGQINEDYDGYDKQLSDYKDREKALSDLFASNPRSAAFLTDWRNGEDPIVGLIRKFGDDFKEALEDPEKQEALAAANKDYAERIAKESEFEEQYQQNIQETLTTLERMQQEEGLSDDDIDKAMEFLISIMRDGLLGKFSPDSIHMALKALNHDGDVEQADREGEIRGRNTKIEEKLRKGGKSDGTANLAGKNGGKGMARQMPDLGVIERGYDSKNIWERGGERRRPAK